MDQRTLEFFLACPESIVDANVNGENALHIAVSNNDQREGLIVLKVLMGWILRLCQKEAELIESRVLNRRDKDDNTALQLAAYENYPQAMKLMLESSKINVNIENKNGLTVLDIAALHNDREIERMVKRHGGKRSVSLVGIKITTDLLGSRLTWRESRRTNMIWFYSWISEERRNALLVVTTLIITATYQTVLQPPGGVSDGRWNERSESGLGGYGQGQLYLVMGMEQCGFFLSHSYDDTFVEFRTREYVSVSPSVCSSGLGLLCCRGCDQAANARVFGIAVVGGIVLLIIWGLVVGFWEWLESKRRGPKSELVWEGFTTLIKLEVLRLVGIFGIR